MTTGGRNLIECVDRFGNIAVDVEIGGGPGAPREHSTGASATPVVVAQFLRDLADDIEQAGLLTPPALRPRRDSRRDSMKEGS